MTFSECWKVVIEFYTNLVTDNPALSPLLEVTRSLSRLELADGICPFTSHNDLCLSGSQEYAQRLVSPIVVIQYLDSDNFRIKYWAKMGNPNAVKTIRTTTDEIKAQIDSVTSDPNSRSEFILLIADIRSVSATSD